MRKYALCLAGAAGLAFSTLPGAASAAGAATTAQDIMASLNAPTDVIVISATSQTWQYDRSTAATYYNSVAWDEITPTCTGACGTARPPPLLDFNSVNQTINGLVHTDKCTFWKGGNLSSDTFTQKVSFGTGHNKVTYTYTFVVSASPSNVDPKAAWDLQTSIVTPGVTSISVDAVLAGESVVVKSGQAKYSFSLGDRVQNLVWTVTAPNSAQSQSSPNHEILNYQNLLYTRNNGPWGNTTAELSLISNQYIYTILNADSLPGNDNGGADGSDAQAAHVDAVEIDNLIQGSYMVNLQGTLKDNNLSTGVPFMTTSSFTVTADNCSN